MVQVPPPPPAAHSNPCQRCCQGRWSSHMHAAVVTVLCTWELTRLPCMTPPPPPHIPSRPSQAPGCCIGRSCLHRHRCLQSPNIDCRSFVVAQNCMSLPCCINSTCPCRQSCLHSFDINPFADLTEAKVPAKDCANLLMQRVVTQPW